MIRCAALLVCVACSFGFGPAWADEGSGPGLVTYRAVYRVDYRGDPGGTSEIAVTYDENHRVYEFRSTTMMSGVLKLMVPHPVVERSIFAYEDGEIVPIEFSYEDGRKGEDNVQLNFDWRRNVATSTVGGEPIELSLQAGALDRGSLQVAVTRDLSFATQPRQYLLADGRSLKTLEYVPIGDTIVDTALGSFKSRGFVQERENSSRRLRIWLTEDPSFLPVRIEWLKDGRAESSLILQSLERLGPSHS